MTAHACAADWCTCLRKRSAGQGARQGFAEGFMVKREVALTALAFNARANLKRAGCIAGMDCGEAGIA